MVLIIFSIGICYVGTAEALDFTGATKIGNVKLSEQSVIHESNALIYFALSVVALLTGMMLHYRNLSRDHKKTYSLTITNKHLCYVGRSHL